MNISFLDILVTSIGSTVLLGFSVFLFKNMLIERLKASVQHEFNEKLTILQDSLKKKSEELNYLRSNLLNGVSERQKLLYSEKIKSVNTIWDNINALASGKKVAIQAISVNYEESLKRSKDDSKVQDFFKTTFPDKAIQEFNIADAYSTRPYLSEYAWVLFKAYSSIIAAYLIRIEILKIGVDIDLGDSESTLTIVKAALPEHTTYIDKHKMNGAYYFLEELESRLLMELKAILEGTEDDTKHLITITSLNEALKKRDEEKSS